MSTITEIRGVPVQFPFQPYDIQKDYMEKVIECVQTESVGVLESPTGTGKTLSLLCSSLAWLQLKRKQFHIWQIVMESEGPLSEFHSVMCRIFEIAFCLKLIKKRIKKTLDYKRIKNFVKKNIDQYIEQQSAIWVISRSGLSSNRQKETWEIGGLQTKTSMPSFKSDGYLGELNSKLEEKADDLENGRICVQRIIYASRTHSQLRQAIQEMKRTAYSHMRANVLGSREQLCIHPEVKAEEDHSAKVQMCQIKLANNSCHFFEGLEKAWDNPQVCNTPIVDIEDMIKLGTTHTFCPYYMTKKMKDRADIIFAPYNYLLDRLLRIALGFNLKNSVVILDEGHNIEKLCEDYASVELKTTYLFLAITELDVVMKLISGKTSFLEDSTTDIKFNSDDVAICKQMLIKFVDVIQKVPLNIRTHDVTNYPGDYIFEMLGKADIRRDTVSALSLLVKNMINFLAIQDSGPFGQRGKGLQLFLDFLNIVFVNNGELEEIKRCYKVHIKQEERRQHKGRTANTRLSAKDPSEDVRVLCFWCFSPKFGMKLIMQEKIIALILTSGTLAPLKSLITELQLNVKVQLENPHVITPSQICVKVLPVGPDGEPLNSNFKNRDNPKYVTSLGRAIVNLSRIIPDGLLIFFPSYPIMQKCQKAWQEQGIWASIMSQKPIFVESRCKDAFNEAMTGYYEKIRDPTLKGAIFMGVCRGKVSEGLDFADANGRAVIITGLPYPPLKDPQVILKRRYMDYCQGNDKEFLNGSDWYSLMGSRAVNQAIGRIIRHRHDYGAILLLDQRFCGEYIKQRMSKWLRDHVKLVTKYGDVIRDISQFFRKVQSEFPAPIMKPPINTPSATFKKDNFDFITSSLPETKDVITDDSATDKDSVEKYLGTIHNPNGSVTLHSVKRDNSGPLVNSRKRKKIQLISKHRISEVVEVDRQTTITEYVVMVKQKLGDNFQDFANALQNYSTTSDLDEFLRTVDTVVPQNVRYVFVRLHKFIKSVHSHQYKEFLKRNNLSVPEEF